MSSLAPPSISLTPASAPLTQYTALYESLRSRKLRPVLPKGLDTVAVRIKLARDRLRVPAASLRTRADLICALSPQFRNDSDAVLDAKLADVRDVFVRRRHTHEHVHQALAMVRELARRETGEEPYAVQIMGALALFHGRVIEMLTGEGKTLTGSLAAPLIAWQHRYLHVLTVNDYLAARDAESRRTIYQRCMLRVGAIVQETPPAERYDIYAREIVYGTPKQIVADWLRDQLRMGKAATPWAARSSSSTMGASAADADGGRGILPMIPGLHASLVDEADAVLIDEGVVPLIIARSRREDEMSQVYREAVVLAGKLDEGPDYEIEPVHRRAKIKSRGEHRLRQIFADHVTRGGQPIWKATRRGEELVRQALVAKHCYILGQQYQVVDGKVLIVDEYTGRFLPDRSWEHGLHQAVEAKEGLDVTADRETLARLSFQRYFRSYPFLCGMTGTAADATNEMHDTYRRPVVVVPTHRPIARVAMPTRLFRASRDKWDAIVQSIEEIQRAGRPILVGTRSITTSELLSRMLTQRGVEHQVLNANFDKDEAELILRAGKGGLHASVTVATNMAGRGTDIKLDDAARKAGGLHVLLTELHGAKRIDRQFIGRAGRQGDPGSSQIFVSLEDELLRKFAKWPANLVRERTADAEVSALPGLLRLLRWAQSRNEAYDRRNRASVLRQDDWIDKHLPGVG
jgi:preprotein translocase subunit SecA